MFAKLLKYEFRSVRGVLTGLSICALVSGVLGGLMMQLVISQADQLASSEEITPAMLTMVASLLIFGILLALYAYYIGSLIILYVRFYRSKFTDEGYLTFTLPASTHKILLASIVNIVIWNAIIYVVLILSLAMILLPVFLILPKPDLPLKFLELYQTLLGNNILIQILSFIGGLVYSTMLPLVSIVLGSLAAKKHKIIAAIGIGYGIHMAYSLISQLLLFFSAVFVNDINRFFTEAFGLSALLQITIGVGGYFLMHYLVKNKLNLE